MRTSTKNGYQHKINSYMLIGDYDMIYSNQLLGEESII